MAHLAAVNVGEPDSASILAVGIHFKLCMHTEEAEEEKSERARCTEDVCWRGTMYVMREECRQCMVLVMRKTCSHVFMYACR